MDSKAQNRRDWVKNIAIIFLVILLLLTFFSRTIMNARLPEVSAQYAQYATLSSAVKANGTVKANASYNVIFEEDEKIEQTRKVQSVYVKAGDTVEKDAPILSLSNDPSEQLKNARADLAEAKEKYTKLLESGTVDGLTSDKTISDAQRAIEKAEDKLKELEAEYNSILSGGDPATVIKDSIKALNNQIKDLEAQKKQAEKDIDAQIKVVDKRISDLNTQIAEVSGKLSSAEGLMDNDILAQQSVAERLAAAQNEYDGAQVAYENAKAAYDALQAEVDRWKEMVDAINTGIGDVNKANELTNQIKSLQDTLDNYNLELKRYEEDYIAQIAELEKTRDQAIETARNSTQDTLSAESIEEEYNKACQAARNAYDTSKQTLDKSHERNREDTVWQVQKVVEDLASAMQGVGVYSNSDIERMRKSVNAFINGLTSYSYSNIENKINDYQKLKNDIDKTARSLGDEYVEKNTVMTCTESINSYMVSLKRAEEDYYYEIDNYIRTRDQAIQTAEEVRSEKYNQLLNNYADGNNTYAQAEEAAWNTYYEAFETLQRTHDRYIEDKNAQIVETENQLADAQAKLYVIDMPEAQANLEKAQADADAAKEEVTKAETTRDEAKEKADTLSKQSRAEGVAAGYRAELNGLKAQLEASEASKERYEESKISSDERYDERMDAIRDKITEKNEELSGVPSKRDPDDVKKEIEAQKDTIQDLKETFEITESTEGNTAADRKRELEKAKQEIGDLEAKVKTYEGAENTKEVNAPIAGKIVSVNFVPGDSVTSGATVASIEIADKGYVVEISMTAEEARKIQVGSPVSVTNSWWYSNISASISQVKSDPQSQGKNRIIVLDVSGDVSEGQSLNFSIGDKSQAYESVLPNSAIREDNEGKFVLTVEAKKTPLGTRYTARRTTVEVIASDDTQSAVNGLYGSEFVITSSTTPITDGQQVRLAGD